MIVVASDFVPSSLPPALRIRFFATHLPEFGWDPVILTVDPEYYENEYDPENANLLPASLRVIRTRSLPARWTRRFGLGDLGIRSLWHQWRSLVTLCRRERPDMVFISVPPYVSMVLGRLIRDRLGIPYVVDYIDPWVVDYYWKLPPAQRPPKWPLAYAMSVLLEPFALRKAGHLVGVSRGTTDGILSRYPWLHTKTSEIPYGGEPADISYLERHPRRNSIFDPGDGYLHVSSVGRGGADLLPVLDAVFQAIRLGLARSPETFSRLRLHFVGTTYAAKAENAYQIMPLVKRHGLEELVDEHPQRVSYLDALQILMDSHGLLAVGSEEAHYTASKIFPYILVKRPLVAVFHEASSVLRVVNETGAGEGVAFSPEHPPSGCIEGIQASLRRLLEMPHHTEPPTDWGAFEPYTTRRMAQQLAAAFDSCIQA